MKRFLKYWSVAHLLSRIVLKPQQVMWTKADAEGLKLYLKSPSGQKFTDYTRTYSLHQQEQAISTPTNLQFNAGACSGARAILAQIETLSEPENFTTEEGFD